ncbi:hypothetical protein BDA96_02G006600 [Sorghum bicolor]|uniref:Uncharacterized protein n=2 Tax=Sorghum bicolor TaxID=4558 RepID=A0A921RK47_SORBI|nr:hypothetical protein BDA96_02G006600 [Sorghum bicolor]OQU88301.1 hypothetical protein SORBI_3002G006001 [Sorghum bicolor]
MADAALMWAPFQPRSRSSPRRTAGCSLFLRLRWPRHRRWKRQSKEDFFSSSNGSTDHYPQRTAHQLLRSCILHANP